MSAIEFERGGSESRCSGGNDSGNEHFSNGSGSNALLGENTIITTSSGNVPTSAFNGTNIGAFPNLGDFCSPHPGFRAMTLFDTPQSLLQSPQYDIFNTSSPQPNFIGNGPSYRCASCSKGINHGVPQFTCAHRTCSACTAMHNATSGDLSASRCPICSAPPAVAANFPAHMFLSPQRNDQSPRPGDMSNDILDTSSLTGLNTKLSTASRSLSSAFANGIGSTTSRGTGSTDSPGKGRFENMLSLNPLGEPTTPIEPLNMWARTSNVSPPSPMHSMFESLNMADDAPVFSPLSPTNTSHLPSGGVHNQLSHAPCQGCGEGERAIAFCLQCKEFLCSCCVMAHQRVRATKQHKFVSMQQFFVHLEIAQQQQVLNNGLKDSMGALSLENINIGDGSFSLEQPHLNDVNCAADSGDSSPRAGSVCSVHDSRVVCICEACPGIALCAMCIMSHPATSPHKLNPIGDLRTVLAELSNEARSCDRACESTLEAVRRMGERVQTSAHAAENEIRSAIYTNLSALEERKRDLLSQVDTVRQTKMALLQAQAERILIKRNAIQQALKMSEVCLEGSGSEDGSDEHTKDAWDQLMSLQLNDVVGLATILQLNENDVLKFHASSDNTLINKIRAFGDVESGPCAKTSSIVGENYKRAIRDRQSMIFVQLRDACNQVMSCAAPYFGNDIQAMIFAPDGHSIDAVLNQRDNGIVAVSYYPVIEGAHTVHVLIKGIPITGCPAIVDVRKGRNYDEIAARGPLFSFGREGSGDGELCRPWGICVDLRGRVLVADRSNNRIQIFDKDGNFLSKFGTGGNRAGQFDRPAGITTNTLNHVIVADKDNHRVQVFDENGTFMHKFGERGRAVGFFNYPWGVATNSQNIIAVSDTRNHRVQIFSAQGQFLRKCGFDSAFFFKNLDSPRGVCYLPDGQLLITDFNNHRLAILSPRNMSEMKVYGSEGDAPGMFVRPQGVKTDPEGHILVCDSRNNRIQVFASDDMRCIGAFGLVPTPSPNGFQMPTELPTPFKAIGGPFGTPGFQSSPQPIPPPPQLLDRPTDLAVGPDGRVYVVDFGNNCIRVF